MTLSNVLGRLIEHFVLVVTALGLSSCIAIPIGAVLAHSKWQAFVVAFLGMLYTVPSLALFAVLVPVCGLGAQTAILVLVIYGVGIIARAVVIGICDIDPQVRLCAKALGFTPRQIMLQVELPLARRSIVNGMRTATIVLIGTASIAAWIDGGGLGALLFTGIRQDDILRILVGGALAALMAIFADWSFSRLERRFISW